MINVNKIITSLNEYKINNILLIEQLQRVQNNFIKSKEDLDKAYEIIKEIEKNIILVADYNNKNENILKKLLLEKEILNQKIDIYKALLRDIISHRVNHKEKYKLFGLIKNYILRLVNFSFIKINNYKNMNKLLEEGKLELFLSNKDKIFKNDSECAKFIINSAKQIHKNDKEMACKLAKLAWIIDPKEYILKWYGFRLIDIEDYKKGEAMLEYVSEKSELSKKEMSRFINIKNINMKDTVSLIINNKIIYNMKNMQKLLNKIIHLKISN